MKTLRVLILALSCSLSVMAQVSGRERRTDMPTRTTFNADRLEVITCNDQMCLSFRPVDIVKKSNGLLARIMHEEVEKC